jgi:hypothetical protein
VKNLQHLAQFAVHNIPDDTLLRLFLVEDVSAPVIELAGQSV